MNSIPYVFVYALTYAVTAFFAIEFCEFYQLVKHEGTFEDMKSNLCDGLTGALLLTVFGTVTKILTDYILGG